MARLEELKVGTVVRGLASNSTVTIKHVEMFGGQVANVTFVDAEGRPGTQLIYRDQESSLEVILQTRPLSFTADGQLFRLVAQLVARPAGIESAAESSSNHAHVEGHVEAHVEGHVEAHEPMNETERNLILACVAISMDTPQLLQHLGYRKRTGNFKKAISRLLSLGYLEMTIPDKPRSRLQQYRLTAKGRASLTSLGQARKP